MGRDNAALSEIDSSGEGVYCQLARGGSWGWAGSGSPAPSGWHFCKHGRLLSKQAEEHPDGQHEPVSWAVEESNVEKGAWSGTF